MRLDPAVLRGSAAGALVRASGADPGGRPMSPLAVLFDIGGVFVVDGPDTSAIARSLGFAAERDVARVAEAVLRHRDSYDLGISEEDYWSLVAADLGIERPEPALIDAFRTADANRWSGHRADTVALARDVAAAGFGVGILSNAPRSMARAFEAVDWVGATVSALTFSCDIGVAKPDVRAYGAALAALDLPASEVVFLDDRQINVDAASGCGLVAHLWTTAETARTDLYRHGLLGSGA